ncbi:uncharacterized protein LOC141670544 [Apium graveolens]|uniref:uncharacterized protein LOC141670544 n=1 Tax=Apium graveolens TaxID=4045 RepID=UPI003D7A02CC
MSSPALILVQDHEPDQSSFSPSSNSRRSSCRTLSPPSSPSFSSSNSSVKSFSVDENVLNSNHYPFSPRTPLHFPGQVPFSWEQIPGIPKNKQLSKTLNITQLPPPPAAANQKLKTAQKKPYISPHASFQKDPFFAAFLECSKDSEQHGSIGNYWKISRVTKTLTNRLGFISMHTNISCKNTCAVSDSISSHHTYNISTRRSL